MARDCALRGLRTLLIERRDLTNGATGRNHGLLHSGARYAVTDPESARECIRENRILRRIASNCIEETGGLFISLPEDDPSYREQFIQSCEAAGIRTENLEPAEALRMEPAANPALTGAVKVPDASVDPFRLTTENALDATLHGARILTYTEITGLVMKNGCVTGVRYTDTRTGEKGEAFAGVTVNAAGVWGMEIASMAGCDIHMMPAKGSLVIFGHRINRMVLNRCRRPSNADILVPGDVVCVLGTTSSKIDIQRCDDLRVTSDEVDLLLSEGVKLAPVLSGTRVLRAYSGVRPLVTSEDDGSGRNVSRGMVIIDHEARDGVKGFITIAGGKLTSYRLMGEKGTDLVCSKLGLRRKCHTAELPLPGAQKGAASGGDSAPLAEKAAAMRHGSRSVVMDFSAKSEVLCKCEHVTRAEISYAVRYLDVHNLIDLRRRTRVGMGTCQGSFCMRRVADALAEELGCPQKAPEFVRQYVKERWKGIAPICWGESLREAEYMRKQYGDYEV